MCGIFGLMRFDDKIIDRRAVETATDSLAHRGPDARSFFFDPLVALGHRRLSIIDIRGGQQPLTNENKNIQVVFNGEIYNHAMLRKQLHQAGHHLKSESDGEVIAHLYEIYGDDFARHLEGMFAIAIYDQRQRQLILATDHVGKKPIFWAKTKDFIVFASELCAIFAFDELAVRIDETRIPEYFTLGYVAPPNTFYQGIKRFHAATVMRFDRDGNSNELRYWRYPLLPESTELKSADASLRCRQLIGDAVEKRLMSDVPLGVFLSGGIDSSIIVAEMRQRISGPIRTFTVGFDDQPDLDESVNAQMIADQFSTEHHLLKLSPFNPNIIDDVIHHYGEPNADASAIPTLMISRETQRFVKVVLNGDGGDEVFGGYWRFLAMRAAHRCPAVCARMGSQTIAHLFGNPQQGRLGKLTRFFQQVPLSDGVRMGIWIAFLKPHLLRTLYRHPVNDDHVFQSYRKSFAESQGTSFFNRVLHANFDQYLFNDLIPKVDRMSMAASLEARSPFLDTQLITYMASLHGSLKTKGSTKKYLLKKLYRGTLPDSILDGPKKGFAIPLDDWFRGPLGHELRDLMHRKNSLFSDHFHIDACDRFVAEHLKGNHNVGQQLYTLLVFLKWSQQHVQRPNTTAPPS